MKFGASVHLVLRLASDGVLDIWNISTLGMGIGISPGVSVFEDDVVGLCVRFHSNTRSHKDLHRAGWVGALC